MRPAPTIVLSALMSVNVGPMMGTEGSVAMMALWPAALNVTLPPPVNVTLAPMMRLVGRPVELSSIWPLLSNKPPILSAAPLPTEIAPALAPAPVPWTMLNAPRLMARVAVLAVLSDLIA